jgi:excisionase family DNA binding protein
MEKEMISTGKAAKLCSVAPDTVLKWIKKKQLDAIKTVGGHYRVNKEDLLPYMAGTYNEVIEEGETLQQAITYCWEYHADNGNINDNCRECMVFKTKAEKCFLMSGLGKDNGHSQSFCAGSCYECQYFHFVNSSPVNVLVVTENNKLEKTLKKEIKDNLFLKFSCCGYDTATVVQDFHPDFIILDESLINSNEICKHLINDPRIHGSQIILATSGEKRRGRLPEGVCATVKIPFSPSDMDECFENLQKNFYGKKPVANN